jgi:hypothetical protein
MRGFRVSGCLHGAIKVVGVASVTLEQVHFQANQNPLGIGGALAISEAASVAVTDSVFTKNLAAHAGGLYVRQTNALKIKGSRFAGNRAVRAAGGAIGAEEEEQLDPEASNGLDDYPRLGGGALISGVGTVEILDSSWVKNMVGRWSRSFHRLNRSQSALLLYLSSIACEACNLCK